MEYYLYFTRHKTSSVDCVVVEIENKSTKEVLVKYAIPINSFLEMASNLKDLQSGNTIRIENLYNAVVTT